MEMAHYVKMIRYVESLPFGVYVKPVLIYIDIPNISNFPSRKLKCSRLWDRSMQDFFCSVCQERPAVDFFLPTHQYAKLLNNVGQLMVVPTIIMFCFCQSCQRDSNGHVVINASHWKQLSIGEVEVLKVMQS